MTQNKTNYKTLLIIRHAKSNQNFLGKDFDRPLNERGIKDANTMAQRILSNGITLQALVSSPAKRTTETATVFCKAFNKNIDEIVFVPALYHPLVEVFYDTITQLPDTLNTVALFSHNTGITDFVNEIALSNTYINMPTCAIFAITIASNNWSNFITAKKEILFFDYPKNEL